MTYVSEAPLFPQRVYVDLGTVLEYFAGDVFLSQPLCWVVLIMNSYSTVVTIIISFSFKHA